MFDGDFIILVSSYYTHWDDFYQKYIRYCTGVERVMIYPLPFLYEVEEKLIQEAQNLCTKINYADIKD